MMIVEAATRGSTIASIGETPIVRIASTSSVSFIVPICAAKADPERPATMIAVIKRPSSRIERSEEHTSELQSLMRISYAVFCLKKKKTHYSMKKYQTQRNNH